MMIPPQGSTPTERFGYPLPQSPYPLAQSRQSRWSATRLSLTAHSSGQDGDYANPVGRLLETRPSAIVADLGPNTPGKPRDRSYDP